MGWELITVMALQAIRNPLPAADTEQEVSCWLWSARWYRLYLCHSAWEMPGISEGFPGPPLQAVFHKMPASFLFVQRFAVRTICSLSQCSGVLQAAPGHLGWNAQDPAKMGLSLHTLDSDTKSLYCQPISAIHPHWPGIGFGQSDYFCTAFYYRIDIGILYGLLGYYEIYLETQLVILILHSSIPRETPLKLFQV